MLGWGPGSVEPILAASRALELNLVGGKPWDHLHSAYVSTLFAFGIVGVLLFGILFAALILPIWRRYRGGGIQRNDAIFFICGFAMIAIYSTTDFRHLNHDWRMFWLLFAGMAYGCSRAAADSDHSY
jgi:O-antigen ligase